MAIFRHTKDLPAAARGAVVVIGNFDGVHRGHQLLLADARRQADALGAPLAVLTFEPHPRSVRSEEHASELQSLMRISYAVFCLKKQKQTHQKCKRQQTAQ